MFIDGRARRTSTEREREHVGLLLDVARRYWHRGESQAQIADAIGYSRPTVSRLLAEAREQGLVTIHISHPQERLIEIEAELVARFGLTAARVADPTDPTRTGHQVGRCAADLLVERAHGDLVLAISNGVSVSATIEAMPQLALPRARTVQMIGSIGRSDVLLDSTEACRNMAARLGGQYHALPVPLVVRTTQTARELRREEQISTTLELAARADIALVGIGAVHGGHSGHIFGAYETMRVQQAVDASGAVAHICGHHLDVAGAHLDTPLCGRTIAVDPARLRSIPLVLGVAWGDDKVDALRAVMAGRFLDALATDRRTALQLLKS